MFYIIVTIVQLCATLIMCAYFYRQLKAQNGQQPKNKVSSKRDMEKLTALRRISLTKPLNEQVRPATFKDIIGQEEGIRALKASLCGSNPQHIIMYGPPGIGKTCAARLVLEAAKNSAATPFDKNAPFIEIDATCVRFDERAIADPLIGSVHDPIYQGAGQLGINGVPQPKEGAVTRAHGGVLFLDEIGELHPIQMNKLLKVLEDRLVRFESAYYNSDDNNTPKHIHDIFKNGLPADFRLIGATTRSPSDLPPALRSRCMEIFFRALEPGELAHIAVGAAEKSGFRMEGGDSEIIGRYASNGREAVNIVQMAAGAAQLEGRTNITKADIEWVVDCGQYTMKSEPESIKVSRPGMVNGLAIYGANQGAVMAIEAVAHPGAGRMLTTGIIEEEELSGAGGSKMRRTSTARTAAHNVRTQLELMGLPVGENDIHINFPGGMPVDGPSAGVAMAVAAYSALTGSPVSCDVAITGELSVAGNVLPVGGVPEKIKAAHKSGLKRVLIPRGNAHERYGGLDIEVIPITSLSEALGIALGDSSISGAESPRGAALVAKPADAAGTV